MVKIDAVNLVNSKEFVREPVDKIVNEILNSPYSKTILTGGKGVGKSTVLCGLEKKGLGSKEQTIYNRPDFTIKPSQEPDETYNEKVFDYFTELRFTNSILFYIKCNYPIIFYKYFKNDMDLLHSLINDFCYQINNIYYTNNSIECKYGIKELSFDIINRFKQIMKLNRLNIAIDGFDRINGSSEYVQKAYEKYFDMFDRVILTADDTDLDNQRLFEKGYEIKNISYGTDNDVLREIIRLRESLFDSDIIYELLTNDRLLDKLSVFNGNINLSLETIKYATELLIWYGQNSSIEEILDEAIKEKINESQGLERVISKKKFYL